MVSSWWERQFQGLSAAVGRNWTRARHRTLLEALTGVCALVGWQQQMIQPPVREKLLGFLEHSDLGQLPVADIDDLLDQQARQFTFDTQIATEAVYQSVAKLKGNDSDARLLVRVALVLADTAGLAAEARHEIRMRLCQVLALDLNHFTDDSAPSTPPTTPLSPPATRSQANPSVPSATAAAMPSPTPLSGEMLIVGARPTLPAATAAEQLSLRLVKMPTLHGAVILLDSEAKPLVSDPVLDKSTPRSSDGAVVWSGDTLLVSLDELNATVHKLVVVVFTEGASPGIQCSWCLERPLRNEGLYQAKLDEPNDFRSAVLVELYRRQGQWKLAVVGSGYQQGREELARGYGVSLA